MRCVSFEVYESNKDLRTSLEVAQLDYTISPKLRDDPFHINVVGGPMTHSIDNRLPDLLDELDNAFGDLLRGENEGTHLYIIFPEIRSSLLKLCTFRLGAPALLFLICPHYFQVKCTVLRWP
jgi:hypothetical protein